MKKLISVIMVTGLFMTLPTLANDFSKTNLVLETNKMVQQSVFKMNKRLAFQLNRDIQNNVNVWRMPKITASSSATLIANNKTKKTTETAED